MPTGYTADIYDGKDVSFEQFAMGCARAFGALIDMRDDPQGAEIPEEFLPSDYYQKNIDKAVKRQEEVKAWDEATANRTAWEEYDKQIKSNETAKIKNAAMVARHDDMIEQVQAWMSPTDDHKELKKFMLDQLRISSEFERTWEPTAPTELSGAEYKRIELLHATQDFERATKAHKDELKRCKSRTKWVQALRESLSNDLVS